MSALIRPRRLTSQPQYPAQVDTGNPIARGLINLYSCGFDAATNRIIPASDGAQLVGTLRGMALPLSGSNYAELPSTIGSTGSVTYVVEFIATAAGGGQDDIISLGDRCTLRANIADARLEFYSFDGANWQQENTVDGTFALNVPAVAVAVHDATAGTNQIYLYQAGVLTQSFGSAASPRSTGSHPLRVGMDDETFRSLVGVVSLAGVIKRALTDAEARSLAVNPWQLLKPLAASRYAAFAGQEPAPVVTRFTRGRITRRRSSVFDYSGAGWFDALLVSPAAEFDMDMASAVSGGTGTASVTLAAATLAATGTLALSGQASATLGAVTLAATGALPLTGAAAPTLATATLAATGAVALSGSAAQTLAAATVSATGALALSATASATLDALTSTATATLALAGASAKTLAPVTSAATATLALAGTEATTLAPLTSAATGTLALSGTSAATLADATLSAAGALALDAAEATTLDDLALSATGELSTLGSIVGAAAITLDNASVNAAGMLAVAGSAGVVLEALSLSAAGHVDIAAALGITLGDVTFAATGATALTASADVLLGDAVVLAEATLRSYTTQLSAQHAAWLESIARLHGLLDPLTVGPTQRGDGAVVQTIADSAGVITLTTITAPSGAAGDSALTDEQAGWLEALARLHGLIDPLEVSATGRGDGTLMQSISESSSTVRIERLP